MLNNTLSEPFFSRLGEITFVDFIDLSQYRDFRDILKFDIYSLIDCTDLVDSRRGMAMSFPIYQKNILFRNNCYVYNNHSSVITNNKVIRILINCVYLNLS